MDKIIKTSKTIRAILKVLFWVVAVVSVVILAAILVALFMKGGTALDGGFSITLGNYSLLLNQEYSSQQLTSLHFMTGPMSRFSTNKNEKSFPILTY